MIQKLNKIFRNLLPQSEREIATKTNEIIDYLNSHDNTPSLEEALAVGNTTGNYDILDKYNVKHYGALGDGVADDTIAIQLALDSSNYIYFPEGTYITSNITMQDGATIFGQGLLSVLKFKTGSTGYLLNGTGEALYIKDLTFDGDDITDYSSNATTGTRSGIFLDVIAERQIISKVSVVGFNNIGIGLNGNSSLTSNGLVIEGCNISNNSVGLDTGPGGVNKDTRLTGTNGAEYITISNNNFKENRYAIIADSGNVSIVENVIYSNGYGFYINGSGVNAGHGNFVGNLCNHSLVYGLYCINNNIGYSITNNNFFNGDWNIINSKGVNISNNNISASNIRLYEGKGNSLVNNWFYTTPTIDNKSLFGTFIHSNYKGSTDTYIDSASPLLVDISESSMSGTPVGGELCTNGSFAADTDWSKQAGWSISAGSANASACSTLLYQSVGATIVGQPIVVTYTVLNYTSGSISFTLASGTQSTPRTANGTYTETVIAGDGGDTYIYFLGAAFTGSIDNVSVRVGTPLPINVGYFPGKFKSKTMNASTLLVYANNAAAIAGGLAVGDFYRTGADPDPICIVH